VGGSYTLPEHREVGYLAVNSGSSTDEMVKEYIDEQEGEQIVDDSRFLIDSV